MEIVTIEKLKEEFNEISTAIQWAFDQVGDYPKRNPKPMLPTKHGAAEVLKYADQLKEWEDSKEIYDNKIKIRKERESNIISIVESFIKDESGLDKIPKQYQDKVYYRAYSDGHSNGYYEVYLKLVELVEIFD